MFNYLSSVFTKDNYHPGILLYKHGFNKTKWICNAELLYIFKAMTFRFFQGKYVAVYTGIISNKGMVNSVNIRVKVNRIEYITRCHLRLLEIFI